MCELQSDGHGREHCAGALDERINLTYFVSIALALAWSMNSSCFSEAPKVTRWCWSQPLFCVPVPGPFSRMCCLISRSCSVSGEDMLNSGSMRCAKPEKYMRGFESEAPCCSRGNLLGSRVCWRIVICVSFSLTAWA